LQFDELCKVTGDREEMGFIYIEQYKRSRGARGILRKELNEPHGPRLRRS
jgi:hypothetical protein